MFEPLEASCQLLFLNCRQVVEFVLVKDLCSVVKGSNINMVVKENRIQVAFVSLSMPISYSAGFLEESNLWFNVFGGKSIGSVFSSPDNRSFKTFFSFIYIPFGSTEVSENTLLR